MAQEAGLREKGGAPAAGARGPPAMLAPFIRYLEGEGFMEFHVGRRQPGREVDWAAVDSGIRLQALVMLGNRLGLGAPYECDGYAGGPVSTPLAEDARALSRDRARLYDCAAASVPGSFRREDFEAVVRGRDTDWLMAASKMADLRDYRSTRELLVRTIVGTRPAYTEEYVSGILDVLEGAGLVKAYP